MPLQAITTLQEFSHILSTEKKLCVVDFTASWCGPCKSIAPFLENMSNSDLAEYVRFLKVDVDDAAEVAEYCQIASMPTFHLYQQGVKVGEMSGANKQKLADLIGRATGIQITVQ